MAAILAWQWRNFLSPAVNEDLAAAEGVPVDRLRLLRLFLLVAAIAGRDRGLPAAFGYADSAPAAFP